MRIGTLFESYEVSDRGGELAASTLVPAMPSLASSVPWTETRSEDDMTGKHFELSDETGTYLGRNPHRLRATRDMPRYGVRKGDDRRC